MSAAAAAQQPSASAVQVIIIVRSCSAGKRSRPCSSWCSTTTSCWCSTATDCLWEPGEREVMWYACVSATLVLYLLVVL